MGTESQAGFLAWLQSRGQVQGVDQELYTCGHVLTYTMIHLEGSGRAELVDLEIRFGCEFVTECYLADAIGVGDGIGSIVGHNDQGSFQLIEAVPA